jgi:hypothetical protein
VWLPDADSVLHTQQLVGHVSQDLVALAWYSTSEIDGPFLGLVGLPFRGVRFTASGESGLVLLLRLDGKTFTSSKGECRVTVGSITSTTLEGSFVCSDVPEQILEEPASVDARGSFSGSA